MIFAYWMENDPVFGERARQIYAEMQRRGDVLCSSLLVLSELLVPAFKDGEIEKARAIESFFHANTRLLPYPDSAVHIFAELRAVQGVKALDALHLATASAAGVDAFLTNDRRLRNVIVPQISFIASIDSEFF